MDFRCVVNSFFHGSARHSILPVVSDGNVVGNVVGDSTLPGCTN